jgi:MFS family permease
MIRTSTLADGWRGAKNRWANGVAVVITAYAFWVVMAGTTVPTPLYPLYKAAFGFDSLMVTVMFGIYALGVVAGLLTLGRLSDQIGRRPVLLMALLLSTAAAAVFLWAGNLTALLIGRVLSGFSAAMITGAATAALVELLPAAKRGLAPVIAVLANMGGLACGTLLAGIVAQRGANPLRLPWAVDAGLVVAGLLAMLLLVPETIARPGGVSLTFQRLRIPSEIRGVFVRSAMAGGAGFAVLGVLTAVTGILLAVELRLTSPALTGFVVFLAFACTAVGQLVMRRIPARVTLPIACAVLIAAAGLVATAVLAASFTALLLASVLTGLGTGIAVGSGVGMITSGAAAHHRGEAVSAYFAILFAMLALPAIGVGVLINLAGLKVAGAVFAAAVATLAAGVLVSLTIRKAAS